MKKNVILLLVFCFQAFQAQSPKLTVKNADSLQVKMSQLLVNVKIVGKMAYTTTEMHFFNKSNRQMEAELLFPLPEGVSVSRYAIDINGKMREAVPVNKNKGKQVFEAIEQRRVDPGLLERVEGNNFKTRIYPIMPNAERIVIIGYEQELKNFDQNNLAYQMVSKYANKLDKFEVTVNVIGANAQPTSLDNQNNTSVLELTNGNNWQKIYQTSIKKTDYQPAENILIKIPIQQEIPNVLMQNKGEQYYFYANTFLENKKIAKPTPNSIGLIWDVSLSCKNRDLKKEINLLNEYFKNIQNTKVTLYFLSYHFDKKETYTITNGNWDALKTVLESTKYDGGTRYSKIKPDTHSEILFFTDGLSSLSNNLLPKNTENIYTISSLVSSDFAFLNYNAQISGGNFINLNEINMDTALDKMLYQNLKFLGVKNNYLVTEVFPSVGTTVSGSFSLAGVSLNLTNTVTLLFGYNNKATLEKTITLNAETQSTNEVNIEKIWAQKKIADLELQYKLNEQEIETMGKKYGIITQNTSLIVLETLNDYILYDIVPPAELREEFDRILKQNSENRVAKQQSNWKNVDAYYAELQKWWKADYKYTAPIKPKKVTKAKDRNYRDGDRQSNRVINVDREDVVVRGYSTIQASPSQMEAVTIQTFETRPNANAINTMQGQLSGLAISKSENWMDDEKSKLETKKQEDSLNKDTIKKANDKPKLIKVTSWNPDRLYLKALKAAPEDQKYVAYLQLRDTQEGNPSFYFDVANYFYNKGDKQNALLVLSNIADLGLENHQLYKSLTYVLRQWQAFEEALYTANQVAKWRPQEPQAHRDLALALEDNKEYQLAFNELIKALEVNYYGEMSGQYAGVEDIILMDINRLTTEHTNLNTDKLDKKYQVKLPVAVRVILNWNQMNVDIDMHVIEPNGEECYYGHKTTEAGARFSKDFTQGYGPEQYLLRNSINGKYQIKTNFFGETTLTESGPITVNVEIYTYKNGKTEKTIKTIQMSSIKEKKVLAELEIN